MPITKLVHQYTHEQIILLVVFQELPSLSNQELPPAFQVHRSTAKREAQQRERR
jgi:hypothetical protein